MEISRERGGGLFLKAKCLEAMYKNKLEFPGGGGRGCKTKKKPSVGGVLIVSGTAHFQLVTERIIRYWKTQLNDDFYCVYSLFVQGNFSVGCSNMTFFNQTF